MGDRSAIEWTDATWNPTTGCDRVSPGCAHCYALDLAARLKGMGQAAYQADGDPRTSGPGFALTLHPARLDIPLRWTRPRRVFVNSMSDLFHEAVPDEFIDQVFAVMAMASQHTFQVLTKRPERMRAWAQGWDENGRYREVGIHDGVFGMHHGSRLSNGIYRPWPLPNVWLGTSVENQTWADRRIPELLATPAAVRFLSMEPLLGPVDFANVTGRSDAVYQWGRKALDGIDWVIVGGESGLVHRPVDPAWVRSIRDQCADAGVPFLFKQWGGRTSKSGGRELDGQTHDGYPEGHA
jgi:protein gp37